MFALALVACEQPAPPVAPGDAAALEASADQARSAADALFARLRGELTAAMQSGGPVAAMSVCKERAPAIAAALEAETGVDIERTALRVRNPVNAPDAWEREMLESFLARHAAGEAFVDMEAMTVDGNALRWMRPIPMGETCAACHGSSIAPEVATALLAVYPGDAATGFEPGALRGAFTARVALSEAAPNSKH
jgi:hypothetical protein